MKNITWKSLAIIMILFGSRVHGYFYHVCVLKRVMNKQAEQQQYVILLGDYHDKKHPANKNQRIYLEYLLKKCADMKMKLIVEDLSSMNNDGRMICCNYGINCSEGMLSKLAQEARELGIPVDNVEFRYCRVAGIGPLLNNIQVNPFSLRSSATITALSLHNEVIDELEKIKKYDDGKQLNNLYKKTVSSVRDTLLKMHLSADQKCTVAHYCSQLKPKEYRQELEKLCIFDSSLIDMNILHSIVKCPEIPFVFVVAGGSHIEQVSAVLKRIGYEIIFVTPLEKSVQPIDISVLDMLYVLK